MTLSSLRELPKRLSSFLFERRILSSLSLWIFFLAKFDKIIFEILTYRKLNTSPDDNLPIMFKIKSFGGIEPNKVSSDLRQYRTKCAVGLCTSSACKFGLILHRNFLTGAGACAMLSHCCEISVQSDEKFAVDL